MEVSAVDEAGRGQVTKRETKKTGAWRAGGPNSKHRA